MHITAGCNVKVNTRSYLFQYSRSTFSPVQKNLYFIGYVETPPRAFKAWLGLRGSVPSNGYLARLPRLASRLQRESHASSAVLLNMQTCPALLSHHLPQDASKNPNGTQQGCLVTEEAALGAGSSQEMSWEPHGNSCPFPAAGEGQKGEGSAQKNKARSWQAQGI